MTDVTKEWLLEQGFKFKKEECYYVYKNKYFEITICLENSEYNEQPFLSVNLCPFCDDEYCSFIKNEIVKLTQKNIINLIQINKLKQLITKE